MAQNRIIVSQIERVTMSDTSTDKDNFLQKDVAFYQTFLAAWIENRMEKDKSLLTLSSLAIGLLITFTDKLTSPGEFILWLFSGVAFLATIIIILLIFRCNSNYIQCLLVEDIKKQQRHEKSLNIMTLLAFVIFIVGLSLTFTLAISEANFSIKIVGEKS